MTPQEELAKQYTATHVLYADRKSVNKHITYLKESPNSYGEARTCDGCGTNIIAVYQSYLAGFFALQEILQKMVDEVRENIGNSNSQMKMAAGLDKLCYEIDKWKKEL